MSAAPAQTKVCGRCGLTKPVSMFYRRTAAADGLQGICKSCDAVRRADPDAHEKALDRSRRYMRLRRYGFEITPEAEAALREQQGRRCAICGIHEDDVGQSLHLDHDHTTGRIRGLLCHKCNTALGLLADNPALFRAALAYLEANS